MELCWAREKDPSDAILFLLGVGETFSAHQGLHLLTHEQ
jgi:hypothetical protein